MNEADEKAWLEYESKAVKEGKLQTGWDTNKDSYIAGRASRDSEVEGLREALQELLDEVESYVMTSDSAPNDWALVTTVYETEEYKKARQALKGDSNAG